MSETDQTPTGIIRETWRWFPAWATVTLAALVLVFGVILAGWQFGWWLTDQNAARQAQLTQNGDSSQATLREQVTANFTTITSIGTQIAANSSDASLITALKTQRAATADQICSDAAEVSGIPLPQPQAQWVAANCLDGTLSTNSPDYVNGAQ
jgi:hypothetical protein